MTTNNTSIDGKTLLITGGTGSFGKACVKYLLTNHKLQAIRIYSRDELKQWQMAQQYKKYDTDNVLRFFIGDVRDKTRLSRGMNGVDLVIHAAALKQVPACEYNPIEAIRTNIEGAINVIDAALDNRVEKVIALSTDKASQPINLYGATKLCSDKLFIHANNYVGISKTKFAVVRYGNVMGSRGSVIPLFKKQAKNGVLTITDKRMTRFWISLEEAVTFVLTSFTIMQGRELFIPKIPSMKIIDLAQVLAPKAKIEITGIRPGEKLHESLISADENGNTYDLGDRYLLLPIGYSDFKTIKSLYKTVTKVSKSFSYNSLINPLYLSPKQMKAKLEIV
jgi:UDP-N-acetylglucosamine 4,6-dehydratase